MNTPVLTREGRERLSQQAARLREEVLPGLLESFSDPRRDGEVVLDYERALGELQRLDALLASALHLEDQPGDASLVGLGDLVTVDFGAGDVEKFLVVDPSEAALDDLRISAASPLAKAMLGRRPGDEVEVTGPGGTYRCRVLEATRQAA